MEAGASGHKKNERLVSVGIPAYNRPQGLKNTLKCITTQTYRKLEIVISDNCSPDHDVEKIAREFAGIDSRIKYYRQPENRGSLFNFDFVLEKATGEYFMWAADDDAWEADFVKRCAECLDEGGTDIAAVMTEARYVSGDIKYDFFPEGKSFYNAGGRDARDRIDFMLKHNYGNLFYSLFRREALLYEGKPFMSSLSHTSMNEIPLFLFVSASGRFRVLPEVLLYKSTNDQVYQQAWWEMNGGRLPNSTGWSFFRGLMPLYKYHQHVLREIEATLGILKIADTDKLEIKKKARHHLMKHFWCFVKRYK
jgi:glycosyltransferase involved in cell wall biosynthesis